MEDELKILQALIVDVMGLLYRSSNYEPYATVRFAGDERCYPILQGGLTSREHDIYYTNAYFPLHDALSIQDGEIMVSYVSYDENHTLITHPFLGFELSVEHSVHLYTPHIRFDIFCPINPKRQKKSMPGRGVYTYGSKELQADFIKFREELDNVQQIMECYTVADVEPNSEQVHWTPVMFSNGGRWSQELNDYVYPVSFYNAPFFKNHKPFYIKCPTAVYSVSHYVPIRVAVEVDNLLFSIETGLQLYSKATIRNFDRIETISDMLREN